MTAEQQARDLLERLEHPRAQELTAGDVVELANLIAGFYIIEPIAGSPVANQPDGVCGQQAWTGTIAASSGARPEGIQPGAFHYTTVVKREEVDYRVAQAWVDPIYDVTYRVLRCPFAELVPVMAEMAPDVRVALEPPGSRTIYSADVHDVVFWFPPEAKAGHADWPNAIAHEAVHGACAVLRDRGLKLTPASEEAWAYYVGYLVREMTARLT